ncbi:MULTISPECIES: peptidase [unclassified Beijerinckia]|uniref:peptidase n=1 Tax=unclassified Beijerinckia TaxID=2638183 RepID=UPI0008980578|nr:MULTISPECIES: peptidase [unclassified Beijerinckia]MDH7794181.1 putative proteasome-type protease [Beijerinckia sp. GAS462]SEB55166.1 putative proteasome-type protease [Beijerinckia sp. 28-YEA-48]
MTYCCGVLVREGLVMIADTRTNAGIDNISTFRKLHIFQEPGEKVMMLATAGNLSLTQTVVNYITDGMENPETKEIERLLDCTSMFAAAEMIGRAVRKVRQVNGEMLEQENVSSSTTLLFGGQMKDRRLRLFMIYSAGNFIEATTDTPFLQIGELKYGKPVLDRAVNYETNVSDALKLSLISMDSTMRSNLSVGLPIDMAVLKRDAIELELDTRIDNTDPYFHDLRDRWSTALRQAHLNIPAPPYGRKKKK